MAPDCFDLAGMLGDDGICHLQPRPVQLQVTPTAAPSEDFTRSGAIEVEIVRGGKHKAPVMEPAE
jgi:hypothetical protein